MSAVRFFWARCREPVFCPLFYPFDGMLACMLYVTYSHVRALRNRHIKKPWRGVSQKSLRNRGVPPRGSKKPATYTAAHGALSRGEEHTHSFSGP